MPLSGLLITLCDDEPLAHQAVAQMGLRRGIELGHRRGRRVPIVVDSPDRHADQQIWGWLNELPGVVFVDVVFVHFDDDCGEPTTLQDRKTCGTETF